MPSWLTTCYYRGVTWEVEKRSVNVEYDESSISRSDT